MDKAGLGVLLHLKTEKYYEADGGWAEADARQEAQPAGIGNWDSMATWLNFHEATLSNIHWGVTPETVPPVPRKSGLFKWWRKGAGKLDWQHMGLWHITADPAIRGAEVEDDDPDAHAFYIYLLGHDSVRNHDIRICPAAAGGRYDIDWTGLIALSYSGDYSYDHAFRAELRNVPFDGVHLFHDDAGTPEDIAQSAWDLAARYFAAPERLNLEIGADGIFLRSPDR